MTDSSLKKAAAERKREQRERDRAAGLVQVAVVVPADRAAEIKTLAKKMVDDHKSH